MELNREQVIKALECCTTINVNVKNCGKCPLRYENCTIELPNACLSLIKELTEKVEAYRNELGEVRVALAEANNDKKKLTEENERLRAKKGE